MINLCKSSSVYTIDNIQIKAIKDNANLKINRINNQIENISVSQLKPKQIQKSNEAQKQGDLNDEIISLQNTIDKKSEEVDQIARDNQVYRLAVKLKVLLYSTPIFPSYFV